MSSCAEGFQIGVVERGVPSGWIFAIQDLSKDPEIRFFLKWEKECFEISQSVHNQPNSTPPAQARTLIPNKNPDHEKYTGNVTEAYERTMSYLRNPDMG